MTKQRAATDTLTPKQRRFIAAYIDSWNATDAARQAGYKGTNETLGSVGCENLRKPAIAALIQQHLDAIIPSGEILQRLAAQARGSLAPFLAVSDDGRLTGFRFGPDVPLHLLKSIKISDKGGVALELYDAQAALVKLGETHGLFKPNRDEDTLTDALAHALNAAADSLDAKLARIAAAGSAAPDRAGAAADADAGGAGAAELPLAALGEARATATSGRVGGLVPERGTRLRQDADGGRDDAGLG